MEALRDWLEAIMGCIRDLPVGLRWSFRRDDSLVKAQSEVDDTPHTHTHTTRGAQHERHDTHTHVTRS